MKTVVISILGTTMDRRGQDDRRWDRWRPNVAMCQHDDLLIDRLELLFDRQYQGLAHQVRKDIARVSPETEVVFQHVDFQDSWDFETVYSLLLDFARAYDFDTDAERYLTHITTGTHVVQICLYLLSEAGYLPGKLLQTAPATQRGNAMGQFQIIDLDLSKYDQIASRFHKEHLEGTTYLKSGIATNNRTFNAMIEQLEQVSIRSSEPILLTGPTGAGKSQLAQRIYALKQQRGLILGKLVVVNCATLKGENAMSALFGHTKGAFTGATSDRPGLLREADGGMLFLDEIGELGIDEQTMLLRAIEDKRFMPFGADQEVASDFLLISGSNRELGELAQAGEFREDLLARIDLWTYRLPSLRERMEDFEANLDYELEGFARKAGHLVSFNKDARKRYLKFAQSNEATWSANFRDLNASVTRMATLAEGGRITVAAVSEEVGRLRNKWQATLVNGDGDAMALVASVLGQDSVNNIDRYDCLVLAAVIRVCRESNSMAAAGRTLFNVSREQKRSQNDSHRLKQLLDKWGLRFGDLKRDLA